jgi:hypothetical protein
MPESAEQMPDAHQAERSLGRLATMIGSGTLLVGAAAGAGAGVEAHQGNLPATLSLGFVAANFLAVGVGTLGVAFQQHRLSKAE